MSERRPLTVAELRRALEGLPDDIPVMAEVTTTSMDLSLGAKKLAEVGRRLVSRLEGQAHIQCVEMQMVEDNAERVDRLQLANGSAWVHGWERFDHDQAGGGDGVLLLTE